ncbi:Chondroitin proteoglycan 2 Precursor [Channa argus]|uniref:chitinase n=1 Tax=Channa argus TaxID=215402 RepID=A0A6G1PTI7_CHAAH|nr:Chondroitin proteoglycan 2 Precursor [Channa argus]
MGRLILTPGLCLIIAISASAGSINEFCKGKGNGNYANPDNPNSYITCSNGLTYVRDCPAGLIFRESLKICDWPTAPAPVGCNSTPKTTRKTTPAGPVDQFCQGKRDGDYTNPNNQYTFYTCSNGLTYLRDCPAGLIFRECLDRCDWPTTPCFTTPKTTNKPTTPGPVDQFCKGKRDGDYTNPKNQYTFYTCSNGLTYLRNCPAGLIFRESLKICDWPTNPAPTSCNSTPKISTSTPTPTTTTKPPTTTTHSCITSTTPRPTPTTTHSCITSTTPPTTTTTPPTTTTHSCITSTTTPTTTTTPPTTTTHSCITSTTPSTTPKVCDHH